MVTTPFDDVTVLAHFPVGVNAKKSSNSNSFSSAVFPCHTQTKNLEKIYRAA